MLLVGQGRGTKTRRSQVTLPDPVGEVDGQSLQVAQIGIVADKDEFDSGWCRGSDGAQSTSCQVEQ